LAFRTPTPDWRAALLGALVACSACGGKTGLADYDRPDVGAGGAGSELEADCGRHEQYTSPAREIGLVATVIGQLPIVREGWDLGTAPPGSTVTNTPKLERTTRLVPDVVGDYGLDYSVQDQAGNQASCDVIVHAIVGPPAALCPEEELFTVPGVPVTVEGEGYDDVAVVRYAWVLAHNPPNALPVSFNPPNQGTTRFVALTAGRYELELTVYDGDESSDSCIAVVNVAPPPEAICPPGPIAAPTRVELAVTGSATASTDSFTTRWDLVERPPTSTAALDPLEELETHLTPDRQGNYRLQLTVTDDLGQSDSCEVTVIGTPTGPTAVCPAQVDTVPLTHTAVTGSAVDDGQIVGYQWSLVGRPEGSAADPPSPANAAETDLFPDLAGSYDLQLTVTDDDGMTGTCTTEVRALNTEGLRVELFWDSAPDMDLHLLHPDATTWSGDLDCNYRNCRGNGLPWSTSSADDDPRLDLDVTSGFGPENINVRQPALGVYRVGVHAYRGNSLSVNVRVYCGGSTTEPVATFGPVALSLDQLWRIVDVQIVPGGCNLLSLENADGTPNISQVSPYMQPGIEPR
jgi:hypothetical protein